MSLKEQLQADLTDAMRAKDEVRRSTLRMALTSVTNEEVAGKQARELTDDEVLKVLARELKKRREAATAYAEAGHPDRASSELAEAAVIEGVPAGSARRRRAGGNGGVSDRRERCGRSAGNGSGDEGGAAEGGRTR